MVHLETTEAANDPQSAAGTRADSGVLARPIRVLHMAPDPAAAALVERCLQGRLADGSTLECVYDVQTAVERLDADSYDVILLDASLADSPGVDALNAAARRNGSTPILVLSGQDDPATVDRALQNGARELTFQSRLDGKFLAEALQQALRRASGGEDAGRPPFPIDKGSERRTDPRYLVAATAVLFPIERDGKPGPEAVASVVDISKGGIGVFAEPGSDSQGDLCLVGVEQPDGSYHYATVHWRYRRIQPAGVRLGGSFVTNHEDVLDKRKLVPRLNTATLQLAPLTREEILHEWALRGIARPYLIDRVNVCPKCQALPTFREGCSTCGSARTACSQLIHHFACAHVTFAADFERQGGLACPKCRARNLVVGADFEYLAGPVRCLDCSATATESMSIGECLKCGLRFPGNQAFDKEVVQFHVQRLDPLAFIAAGR